MAPKGRRARSSHIASARSRESCLAPQLNLSLHGLQQPSFQASSISSQQQSTSRSSTVPPG
ncbi:hypothetical protein PT974_10871 [Cladobotryum mycophilum]|uniref:Uncharacterized protein n=1 Tax=Cladobotryum mycophilum TaxID=491253 RepID=A0ABR0SB88_9HYPO